MIERTTAGMRQTYRNPLVDEIRLPYSGDCVVRYTDGSEKLLPISADPVYTAQYGIPLSEDGSYLAIGSWETGVAVYATLTGEKLWSYRTTRITRVMIAQPRLIAVKYGKGILQFDLLTGSKTGEIRSTTAEKAYPLPNERALVCSVSGKYAVVRLADLAIERQFPKSALNPNQRLSFVITDARAEDGRIVVYGFEGDGGNAAGVPFRRVLCRIE
ncbi:MAG: hypothetical protein IJJ99_02315 [Oscillospiraceae bacterium]|nr:hypothetical protein [Oscillospiraceae bacterium]